MFAGCGQRTHPVAHPQFLKGIVEMPFDRRDRDHQMGRDLGIGQPAFDQLQQFDLAFGQRVRLGVVFGVGGQDAWGGLVNARQELRLGRGFQQFRRRVGSSAPGDYVAQERRGKPRVFHEGHHKAAVLCHLRGA